MRLGWLESHRLAVAFAWTIATAALLVVRVPTELAEVEQMLLGVLPLDKLVHVALFGLLALLWRRWLEGERRARVALLAALVVAVTLYGGALELLQPFFARDADWADLAADAVGALVAGIVPRRALRL